MFAPGHNLVGDLYSSFGPEWSIHLNRPALTETFIQAIHRAEISRLSVPPHGWKDHPGYVNGKWERKESWLNIVGDIKYQRFTFSQLIVADGHLGIWTVLGEFHPTGESRGAGHKFTNVLDVLPKRVQEKAAKLLKAIPYATTQAECVSVSAMPLSPIPEHRAEAADTLMRDSDSMVTFYAVCQLTWKSQESRHYVLKEAVQEGV